MEFHWRRCRLQLFLLLVFPQKFSRHGRVKASNRSVFETEMFPLASSCLFVTPQWIRCGRRRSEELSLCAQHNGLQTEEALRRRVALEALDPSDVPLRCVRSAQLFYPGGAEPRICCWECRERFGSHLSGDRSEEAAGGLGLHNAVF